MVSQGEEKNEKVDKQRRFFSDKWANYIKAKVLFYSVFGWCGEVFFENFREPKNFLLELYIGLKFEVFSVKFGEKQYDIPQNQPQYFYLGCANFKIPQGIFTLNQRTLVRFLEVFEVGANQVKILRLILRYIILCFT